MLHVWQTVTHLKQITTMHKNVAKEIVRINSIAIWLFNIAMENDPFIDDVPTQPPFIVDFPWLC